jgi:hypothetical protein
MSNFSNNAIPIGEIETSRVLPRITSTDTGGNTAQYESNKIGGKRMNQKQRKYGGKKRTVRKNKRSKKTRKQIK